MAGPDPAQWPCLSLENMVDVDVEPCLELRLKKSGVQLHQHCDFE